MKATARSLLLGTILVSAMGMSACSDETEEPAGVGGDTSVGGKATGGKAATTGGKATGGANVGGKATGGAGVGGAGVGGAGVGGAVATGGKAPVAGAGGAATGGVAPIAGNAGKGGGLAGGPGAGSPGTGGAPIAGGAGAPATGGAAVAGGAGAPGTGGAPVAGAGGTAGTTGDPGAAGDTGTAGAAGAAASLQYIRNDPTASINAGATGGETILFNPSTPLAVTAGDWIIVDTTIAYADIGQTYVQVGFTPTGGSASFPMLDQIYGTAVGLNSSAYYTLYVVPSDGTIGLIKFNNFVTAGTSTMTALVANTPVTYTNLKVVRIAAADKNTLAPALVEASTATLTVPTATPTNLEWSPTISETAATVGQTLVGVYTRGAIAADWKNHYINSAWTYKYRSPSKDAQTIRIYNHITTAASSNWLQIGIEGLSPAATDTLTITNVEVRLVPAL